MRALSIRQPYAFAIVNGWKDIENRDWPTRFRGPVLVHAGKKEERDDVFDVLRFIAERTGRDPHVIASKYRDQKALGCIVGAVDIADCVTEHASGWFYGPYGFVLTNGRPCKPVACRGALGFFTVPDEVARELREPRP
ncbi:ASCH domain-containing protein [Marinibaculum pumilum]|uniref:ASCH domain-containing protein n=1 Tax=Marinibaculum pumilum TaxID=1766165 RepID=A0ABV7L2W3_9PROT